MKILAKNCIGYNGQKSKNRDFRKFQKILDIGVFYMSSISAMGPHFFHWKNKLWVRGGRSRLALSENIENYLFSAVYDRFMPSKPANLRDPYKIRFSIFLKVKNVVNPTDRLVFWVSDGLWVPGSRICRIEHSIM